MIDLTTLPESSFLNILHYLSYQQIGSLSQVSRHFHVICGSVLNTAFLNLEPRLQAQIQAVQHVIATNPSTRTLSTSLQRYKILQILACEVRALRTVCAQYVTRGQYNFAGGSLLDIFYRLIALKDYKYSETVERSVTVSLYLLCEDFADHFEEYVEPTLIDSDAVVFAGAKIVDLLDCFLDSKYRVTCSPADKSGVTRLTGSYEVYSPSEGITAPPVLKPTAGVAKREDLVRLVRYMRNTARWHNLCHCVGTTSRGKTADRLLRLDVPGDVVAAGNNHGDDLSKKAVYKRSRCAGEGKGYKQGLACTVEFNFEGGDAPARIRASSSDASAPPTGTRPTLEVAAVASSCRDRRKASPEGSASRRQPHECRMNLRVRYSSVEHGGEVTREAVVEIYHKGNACYFVEHMHTLVP